MKKMRIWVAAFAATISLMPCMAQEPQEAKQISETIEIVEDSVKENEIFQVVETMPEFPGGL